MPRNDSEESVSDVLDPNDVASDGDTSDNHSESTVLEDYADFVGTSTLDTSGLPSDIAFIAQQVLKQNETKPNSGSLICNPPNLLGGELALDHARKRTRENDDSSSSSSSSSASSETSSELGEEVGDIDEDEIEEDQFDVDRVPDVGDANVKTQDLTINNTLAPRQKGQQAKSRSATMSKPSADELLLTAEEAEGGGGNGGVIMSRNELPEPELEEEGDEKDKTDGIIDPKLLVQVGTVLSVTPGATSVVAGAGSGATLVIQASLTDRTIIEGTLLLSVTGAKIGKVYEVFGPITQPFYTVRLPRTERAVSGGAEQPVSTSSDVEVALHAGSYAPGNAVYCLPTHQSTAFVSPDMIRTLRLASKPTDASNMFDEELPEDEQEYSDDEAEAAAKSARKQKRAAANTSNSFGVKTNSSTQEFVIPSGYTSKSRDQKRAGVNDKIGTYRPGTTAPPPPPPQHQTLHSYSMHAPPNAPLYHNGPYASQGYPYPHYNQQQYATNMHNYPQPYDPHYQHQMQLHQMHQMNQSMYPPHGYPAAHHYSHSGHLPGGNMASSALAFRDMPPSSSASLPWAGFQMPGATPSAGTVRKEGGRQAATPENLLFRTSEPTYTYQPINFKY